MSLKNRIKRKLKSNQLSYYIYRQVGRILYRMRKRWITPTPYLFIKMNPVHLKEYNELLADREERNHSLMTKAMPTSMTINTDGQCNLQCIMCFRRTFSQESLRAISADFGIFRKVADEVFPYLRRVLLTVWGEPLMDATFGEQLRIMKEYSVRLDLITNGTLLDNDRLINEILTVLDVLSVSLDAATMGTYESIRVGAKFEQVIENIKRFNYLRRKILKERRPRLELSYVLMRRNIEEFPQFVELAKELEADWIQANHLVVHREEMRKESLVYYKELANHYLLGAQKRAGELNVGLNILPLFKFDTVDRSGAEPLKNNSTDGFRKCPFLWKGAVIQGNGDVSPCCVPGYPIMGNIKEKPFREIWNNGLYQEMRRRLSTDTPFECCKHCFFTAPSGEESLFHIY